MSCAGAGGGEKRRKKKDFIMEINPARREIKLELECLFRDTSNSLNDMKGTSSRMPSTFPLLSRNPRYYDNRVIYN